MKKEFISTLTIAIPLIIGNLTQMSYSLIDTAMIGIIGYKELAAASLASNIVSIPQIMGMGLMIAITPLVAIANAQNQHQKISHLFYNGWIISIISGIFLAVTVHIIAFYLPQMGQDAAVAALAKDYLIIMGYSLIPMMIFMACKHFSDGLEFTKTAMLLSLLSLPLNAFLCWIFIYGNCGFSEMGINGAGIATLISRIILALAMMIVLLRHKVFSKFTLQKKENWRIKKKTFKEIFAIGIPGSLQYFMEAGAFAISGIMVGWLGAVQQAAHQIALNCASTTFMVSLGFSLAGSIRVSTAFGGNYTDKILKIGKSTLIGGLLFGILSAIVLWVFSSFLPKVFTDNKLVINAAASLLILAALFQVSDATQAIGLGLCRGIKDVVKPTIYVAIAYWVIGIPLGYILAFQYHLNAAGIWIGLVVGLSVSAILLNKRFFKTIGKMQIS